MLLRKLSLGWNLLLTQVARRPRFGSIGARTILHRPRALYNARHIRIGARCLIESDATLYAVTEYAGQSFQPEIRIGDRAYINHSLNITAAHRVVIGNDVMMAFNVSIFDCNHGFSDRTRPVMQQPLKVYPRGVEICDGAWIGANVFICGNVRVGKGAVIGANSVVKHDVPDHTVVAGNPATLVERAPAASEPLAAPSPIEQ